jgi:hypothetical protein
MKERCLDCGERGLLLPARGRAGGERLCLGCGHRRRAQQRLPVHCPACGDVLLIANGEAVCCRQGCERYAAPAPGHEERHK